MIAALANVCGHCDCAILHDLCILCVGAKIVLTFEITTLVCLCNQNKLSYLQKIVYGHVLKAIYMYAHVANHRYLFASGQIFDTTI